MLRRNISEMAIKNDDCCLITYHLIINGSNPDETYITHLRKDYTDFKTFLIIFLICSLTFIFLLSALRLRNYAKNHQVRQQLNRLLLL